jgi:hypothetical protein
VCAAEALAGTEDGYGEMVMVMMVNMAMEMTKNPCR